MTMNGRTDETRARVEGVVVKEKERDERVRGQRVRYYSPVRFWRRGGEEVVDLESTGRLRVEARQERHQSLLSRSLTHREHIVVFQAAALALLKRPPKSKVAWKVAGSSVGLRRSSGSGQAVQQDINLSVVRERTLGMSMANEILVQVQQRCRLTC